MLSTMTVKYADGTESYAHSEMPVTARDEMLDFFFHELDVEAPGFVSADVNGLPVTWVEIGRSRFFMVGAEFFGTETIITIPDN